MTNPPARIANEQRIASLEAQLVTLREALKNIENDDGSIPQTIWNLRNAALSASADYANKVVVDRTLLDETCDVLNESVSQLEYTHANHLQAHNSTYDCGCPVATVTCRARSISARFDSLRSIGGGE